jgi:hypothetical protein
MGTSPDFKMVHGVRLSELASKIWYDEDYIDFFSLEIDGEIHEIPAESMEEGLAEILDPELSVHRPHGEYFEGCVEVGEQIIGTKVWRLTDDDPIADFTPDNEKIEKVTKLLKEINPDVHPRLMGVLDYF